MTDSKLIDSSVWIAYLFEGKFIDEIEIEETFLISALSLFEIKAKLLKKKIPGDEIKAKMEFIKKKSIVIPITEEIAEKASNISFEKNIPMADSLIYASAISNNSRLITLDNDFRGLPDAAVLN